MNLGIVIPTIGRIKELKRLLESLRADAKLIRQIIIVGNGPVKKQEIEPIISNFKVVEIKYIYVEEKSSALARNEGVKHLEKDIDLVAFFDDDIVLEKNSLSKMITFWDKAHSEIAGAAFNIINPSVVFLKKLKYFSFIEKIGLYTREKGRVVKSGFHMPIGTVDSNLSVDWLSTEAVIYRRKVLDEFQLDNFFKDYSYLEDLDLSYRIRKKYKLYVVADSRYFHYPSNIGRIKPFDFGKMEVINRLYFVNKHQELSAILCYTSLFLKLLLNLFSFFYFRKKSYLFRAIGNIYGIFLWLFNVKERIR